MILCCGEALIDMIPVQADGQTAYVPHAGGAIFNTAIALGRLGVPAGFLSGVSNDVFGQKLATDLTDNGVATDLLIRSDLLTTLAVVHLVDGKATYSFYDENSAGRILSPSAMPEVPANVAALYFGGISLVGDPAGAAYAALLEREAASKLIMLDPNIRTSFITDETGYRARINKLIGLSDIVKVSDEDMEWITGGSDLSDMGRQLLDLGAKLVIITRGAEGAIAMNAQGQIEAPAVRAKVVDTVGAGDTFNAGFLAGLDEAGLLSKSAIAETSLDAFLPAMTMGAKVAAVTVSRAGANPPWRHELSE